MLFRSEREKEFRDVEKKDSKHHKNRFAEEFAAAEEERFKKEREHENEEASRKFEECAECKSKELCDEERCFEEGFGISSFFSFGNSGDG